MRIVHIFLLFLAMIVSSCKPDGAMSGGASKFVFTKDGVAAPTGSNNSVAPTIVPVGPSVVVVSANPMSGVTSVVDVLISKISSGDMVSIYTDKNCTIKIGGAISTSTSVLVTTSNLIIGDYLFYAKSLNAYGISSECSNIPAPFSFTGPNPVLATSMALQTPTTNPNHIARPTILLGGVQPGDIVHLYTNSSCTVDVGSNLATATTATVQTNTLPIGDYVFYTKSFNAYGLSTACSSSTLLYLAYTYNYLIDLTLTYDFVPNNSGKWDYANTTQKPLRNVYVEIKKASNGTLISAVNTDSLGNINYYLNRNESVYFEIYAESKSPSITIQDNSNAKSKYIVRTATYTINGDFSLTKNISSGWGGSNTAGGYISAREAAPYAILDSIYTATLKMKAAVPSIVFPALKVNWSVNNASGTYYNLADQEIYVAGKADVNADEYDRHVIVRQWAHYFEKNFSRNDSMGGVRALGDIKDPSFAFSEGFATAMSAIVFDPDVLYIDVAGVKQQTAAVYFDVAFGASINPGWFSEMSVAKILYNIYANLGIVSIYDILTSTAYKNNSAITSIFSFINTFKNDPAYAAFAGGINTFVANEGITAINDIYGTAETNIGVYANNLPIFKPLILGGAAVNLLLWGDHTMNYGDPNSALNNRYIKFTATSTVTQFSVTAPDSFSLQVTNRGVLAKQQPAPAPIGSPSPILVDASWSYVQSGATLMNITVPNISTVIGEEYIVRISVDKNTLRTPAINNLNISLSGVAL